MSSTAHTSVASLPSGGCDDDLCHVIRPLRCCATPLHAPAMGSPIPPFVARWDLAAARGPQFSTTSSCRTKLKEIKEAHLVNSFSCQYVGGNYSSVCYRFRCTKVEIIQRTSDKSDTEHLKYLEVLEKLPDKKGVLCETSCVVQEAVYH
ncbi:hypothetical protein ZEAMMB73_Zm00001d017184 [Zea mays]|uniref:Uncharacterized protein n=1 Tax=Zea mays TaxID=4577 RepID=A0A1D6HCW0_MAIZE|nr:hypothetical protein ZEAMMB73_Zm00001d017184 [Zea mays]